MIQSEKDLEDYICNNQEKFIETLKNIYGEDEDIKFLGRQIKIGQNNIADLIYYFKNKEEIKDKDNNIVFTEENLNYIIVELKFRNLEPKDLSQLQRYINSLQSKLLYDNKYLKYITEIYGVFVSLGENNEMQDIAMSDNINNISYIQIETNINYKINNWAYKDEYIKNINLDKRIEKLYNIEENKNARNNIE